MMGFLWWNDFEPWDYLGCLVLVLLVVEKLSIPDLQWQWIEKTSSF